MDGVSARFKACVWWDNIDTEEMQKFMHAQSGIWNHDPDVSAVEEITRPRPAA
jgi:hypothetical protein